MQTENSAAILKQYQPRLGTVPHSPWPARAQNVSNQRLKNWVMSYIQNLSWCPARAMPSTTFLFHHRTQGRKYCPRFSEETESHTHFLRPNSGEMGLKFKPRLPDFNPYFCFLVYYTILLLPELLQKERLNGSKIHLNCKLTHYHTETWSQDISKKWDTPEETKESHSRT